MFALEPVGYWPADEGEGDVLHDATLSENHAQLHNVEWEDGLLYFRALYQWAEIPASELYKGRKFSLGGWVFLRNPVGGGWSPRFNENWGMTFFGNGYHTSGYRLDTLDQDEVLFRKSAWSVGGGSPEGVSLRIRRGQRVDVLSHGQDDAMQSAKNTDQVAIGEWQHVLYTFESPAAMEGGQQWLDLQDTDHFYGGGVGKLYVNGELVQTNDRVLYAPRMAPFLIGSDANWWLQSVTSGSLDGSLRDLVIFDRALSQEEVASLYSNTRPKSKPQVFGSDTVFLNERSVDPGDLDGLSSEQSWEILQQLRNFEHEDLKRFTPWLKTQTDAVAVELLLKLGEHQHLGGLVPEYVSTFENGKLSDEQRADALLALIAIGDLADDVVRQALLDRALDELAHLQPQTLNVEDYHQNALIYALYQMDPGNEFLETFASHSEKGFFSQGDDLRDAREEAHNPRAYTPSAQFQGKIYHCGEGVAFRGVEPVSAEELESIARQMEDQYPTIRRWAEGRRPARVVIHITDEDGGIEKVYPLGRTFIFDQTDEKLAGWSIAFDGDGYAHLTGGMHNAAVETDFMPGSWEEWGISRQLQDDRYPTILYWVSETPGDISSLEFVGHRSNTRNIPLALGMNYMNFVQDRNQELYIYGRIHVQGIQSWGMYRYDTDSKTWSALGGFAPDVKRKHPVWSDRFIAMVADWLALPSIRWRHNHPHNTVLAWSRQPHFYNFIRGWGMRWGPDNRMHVKVELFALDQNNRNGNRFVYAYSDDNGSTFHNAAGGQLVVPLTANPGPGNASIKTPENLKRWNLWVTLLGKRGDQSGLNTF